MSRLPDRTYPLSIAKRTIVLLFGVIFAGFLPAIVKPAGPSARAPARTKPAAQTVQQIVVGQKCQQCHKEIVESYALDAHGKSGKFLRDSRATTCESCHGDGTKHIETLEARDIANPPKQTTAQANESCLQCHARDRKHDTWRGSQHDRKDISCLTCHSAHHARSPEMMLARLNVEDTCLGCHTDKRKALYQRSTHLFRTEQRVMKVNCVSCHDPHGGEGRKMLVAGTTNGLCYQCHAEKRGPLLWEHAPVQENCLTCHTPHGSNNVNLLTTRSHQLCQQCHVNLLARHQTVAGFDVFTFNKGCVSCHTQVHGSNHPSGRALTR